MIFEPTDFLKLAFAVISGGLIGFERRFRDKPAGLRTLIFICVGSAAFTILSAKLADGRDPTRIAASIITGIGFLGAGVILRDRGRVVGLTTAATIWLTAALGMAVGGGYYAFTLTLLAFALIILWLFPFLEEAIDRGWQERHYDIICSLSDESEPQMFADFKRHGLRIHRSQQKKIGDTLHFFWKASGPKKCHESLIRHLVANPAVKEFSV